MKEDKEAYKLNGQIAFISVDFQTNDITINIPDGIKIRGVEQNAKPGVVEDWWTFLPSKRFTIKEIFISKEAIMEHCRCFDDRMNVLAL